MAVQDVRRLRELVNDHYHGLMTVESYRQQRAELLDNIGTHEHDDFDITTRTQRPQLPAAEKEPTPTAIERSAVTHKSLGLAIGGVAILGVGIAAVLLTRSPESNQDPDNSPPSFEIPVASGTNRGDELLEQFLSRNNWSNSSLADFAATWHTLDDRQREQAQAGSQFRRLTGVLNQRLREESALGTTDTDVRVIALTGFAAELGIKYTESQIASRETQNFPDVVPHVGEEVAVEGTEDSADPAQAETIEEASPDATELPNDPAVADPPASVASGEPFAGVRSGNSTEVQPAQEAEPAVDKASIVAINDPCPAEISKTRRPYCQDLFSDGGKGPPLVVLQPGDFEMGSDRHASEAPTRQVSIDYAIAMSLYEVTMGEYEQFCESTSLLCPDANGNGDDYPAVLISWDDAVLYTRWLSDETGFNYRLPSEAEWEFAARGGTQTPYFFGDALTPSNAHSMVNGQADLPLPRSDRSVNRNPFKLHHMSGNVREWVQDSWFANYQDAPGNGSARVDQSETRRVVRGGSYSDPGFKLRSAAREALDHAHRDNVTGFRIVREILE